MTTYANTNFKTKKALKEAVAKGQKIGVHNPGIGYIDINGTATLSGPHFPKPHTWYANVTLVDGYITSVR